jgi:hypothetical protein
MCADPEQSRKDKSSNAAPPPNSTLLTRAEAAALLRCSISSIRRLEGSTLHPVVGPHGVHLFDPAELVRVASERSSSAVDASKEGERDARVFEALDEGTGLRGLRSLPRRRVQSPSWALTSIRIWLAGSTRRSRTSPACPRVRRPARPMRAATIRNSCSMLIATAPA